MEDLPELDAPFNTMSLAFTQPRVPVITYEARGEGAHRPAFWDTSSWSDLVPQPFGPHIQYLAQLVEDIDQEHRSSTEVGSLGIAHVYGTPEGFAYSPFGVASHALSPAQVIPSSTQIALAIIPGISHGPLWHGNNRHGSGDMG
jgi:hypothetical protein